MPSHAIQVRSASERSGSDIAILFSEHAQVEFRRWPAYDAAMDGTRARPKRLRQLMLGILLVVLVAAALISAAYWSAISHLRAAQFARRNDSYSDAERHLASCWRLPGLKDNWELEHNLVAVQQGHLADEEAWRARARRSKADGVLILEALAKGNLAVFQWNEARGYAEAILEREPAHARALWLRGRTWVKLQQEPKALDDFQQALEHEPDAAEIHLSLADLLHKLGHVREADGHYRRLLAELPGDPRVILALAHCRQEEDLRSDARKLVETLLAARPQSVPALVERGRIALRSGQIDDAEQWLRRAFELRPDDTEASHLLQLCFDAQRKTDDLVAKRLATSEPAQVAVRLKIQDAPRDPALLVEQGRWLMRAGEWREAVGWFYLALKEDSQYVPAHEALAEYFLMADQPARAKHHARLAGQSSPTQAALTKPSPFPTISLTELPQADEAQEAEVRRLCATCHTYPPPESFPRVNWRKEVKQGFDLLRDSALSGDSPSLESVVLYYERRAPERLPTIERSPTSKPSHFKFEPLRSGWLENVPPYPGMANLQLADLAGDDKLELLANDTRLNRVLLMKPYGSPSDSEVLPQVLGPCHTAVVDLDADGQREILVASLGQFYPTDAKVGSVQWLSRNKAGKFDVQTLLDNVGRVSDVQAGDFNADGKLDLIVAAFGWRRTGEILYLENQTIDWSKPEFTRHVVETRHGAIHVPIVDLDRDGRLDFVALLSQEHETVVAYLNEGEGAFRPKTIFVGPHPAYGSSGIEVTDLDGDGDHDVLLTNGDVLDRPYLLKPYHGIQWLENKGAYPFEHHALASLYGASRAVAADFDGDQDLDVVATSFLPRLEFPDREKLQLPSILLLEQTARGQFKTHVLESGACDHFTCTAGDWDADGDADFAVGNFSWKRSHAITDAAVLWFNRAH
jgi:tetratricopeptide (TPR) repeat protein